MTTEKTALRVGREVRAWMARTGRTQADIADVLGGISLSAVNRRLNGQVPFDVTELTLLATYFGVSPAAFMVDPAISAPAA